MLVDSDSVWRGAPQTIDNTDGHHERYTNFETFDNALGEHWPQFSGGRVLRARAWRDPRARSPIVVCRWRNQGDIYSALRLEAGASLW